MKHLVLALLLFGFSTAIHAQDPLRFSEEVAKFKGDQGTIDKTDLILFTGSSSIRLWEDFDTYFPNHNVLNRGFGGSETSDLIYHAQELIFKYQPSQIFIYEGDNDINSGERPGAIIKEMKQLLKAIRENISDNTPIVLISAKPSIARLHLKKKYLTFNKKLKKLASKSDYLTYADVWSPVFNEDGSLMADIFKEDDLHMNKKGYDIWIKVIAPLLKK